MKGICILLGFFLLYGTAGYVDLHGQEPEGFWLRIAAGLVLMLVGAWKERKVEKWKR